MYNLIRRIGDNMAYIDVKNISKSYKMGEIIIKAIENISFEIEKGELVVILGPSGAGKTTVLNILGGMDIADSGTIVVDGEDISKYNKKQLTNYRRYDIGFVFQFYNLVGNLTALENVSLASQICKNPKDSEETLKSVGLQDRMNHFPAQLSGGERRRAEIARCLAIDPKFIMLDEPFAGVDPIAVQDIQTIVARLKHKNIGILITDHNVYETLSICDRAYLGVEGKVLFQGTAEQLAENEIVREKYLGKDFVLRKKDL